MDRYHSISWCPFLTHDPWHFPPLPFTTIWALWFGGGNHGVYKKHWSLDLPPYMDSFPLWQWAHQNANYSGWADWTFHRYVMILDAVPDLVSHHNGIPCPCWHLHLCHKTHQTHTVHPTVNKRALPDTYPYQTAYKFSDSKTSWETICEK